MKSRESMLQCLNDTVVQLSSIYQNMSEPQVLVYELWTAKDVLVHLTFWHESFARNVDDLINDRKPTPLKGRFIDLNQSGVAAMRQETLAMVMERFQAAHRVVQENILNRRLSCIPYKIGSRDYTPEEHLSMVDAHIRKHLQDVRKAATRSRF